MRLPLIDVLRHARDTLRDEGSTGPYRLLVEPDDYESFILELTRGIIGKAVIFRNPEGFLTFEDIIVEEVSYAVSPDDLAEGTYSQPEGAPVDH